MLKEYEIQAIRGLLVRLIDAGRLAEASQAALQHAQQKLAEAHHTIRTLRAALAVFGFSEEPDLWDKVKAAVGEEVYAEAFQVAPFYEPFTLNPLPVTVASARAAPFLSDGGETNETALQPISQMPETDTGAPNIKEMVLQKLKEAGKEGIEANKIKESLRAQGVEMHDKTVGMNLYRLSQDGLAERLRRTWFYRPRREEEPADDQPSTETSAASIFD
ncbi:hypothetical protein [Rhizobium sp. BK491]|uniref:hypothetical protein n=1 Tax=Rhizobium sp. BK491 TaxID=2587009 RepID=UPI0016072F91|nr:hypothetical protein [Rhizobium sp. BK491]MBB3567914.1 hypothetical protein [Rhizobium sp. BK491]